MNKLNTFLLILFACSTNSIKAQEFINGDLSGTISGISSLPTNWLSVPYSDPTCLATLPNFATPDLTSLTLPAPVNGIIGNPYSGSTFVSGVLGSLPGNEYFQEGIMQTISGFIPGNVYPINFHQAVVKQANCLDSSGSWAVYLDTTLIGISTPTFSSAPFNSTSFTWELKTLTFTATAVSHTIKFLPMDDDNLWSDSTGSCIRMGIDCIYILNSCDSVISGIDNSSLTNSFDIYPNPFTDQLTISTKQAESLELILYNLSSRKLSQQTFTNTSTMNTEHLAKGIYIYEIRNRDGKVKTGKVIKE